MEVFTSELAVSCFIKSLRTLPRKNPNSLLHIETVSQPADLLLAGTYKKKHHSGCDEYKFNNRFSECECGCRLAGRELKSNNGEETTRVCTQSGSVRETAGRSGWRRRREEGMQSLEREGERGKSTAGPEDEGFLFSHAGAELEIVTAGAKVDHRLLSSIFSPFSDFSHMRFSFFFAASTPNAIPPHGQLPSQVSENTQSSTRLHSEVVLPPTYCQPCSTYTARPRSQLGE